MLTHIVSHEFANNNNNTQQQQQQQQQALIQEASAAAHVNQHMMIEIPSCFFSSYTKQHDTNSGREQICFFNHGRKGGYRF